MLLLLFLLWTTFIQVSGLTKLYPFIRAFALYDIRYVSELAFLSQWMSDISHRAKSQNRMIQWLANAIIIVFYVKTDIPVIRWTTNGMENKTDSHASGAARPQRVIRRERSFTLAQLKSAYRLRCVMSKFPSQKNGNRVEHRMWEWPRATESCHQDFPLSHSQLPWHSAPLGAASEAWSFQQVDYGAVSLRPCWLTSVSVNRAICPLMPQLDNFLSISSLLKKDVYFVVITA